MFQRTCYFPCHSLDAPLLLVSHPAFQVCAAASLALCPLCPVSVSLPLYQLHLECVSAHPVLIQVTPDFTLPFPHFFSPWILPSLTESHLFPPYSLALFHPLSFCFSPRPPSQTFLYILIYHLARTSLNPSFPPFPLVFSNFLTLVSVLTRVHLSHFRRQKQNLSDIKIFPGSCQVLFSKSRYLSFSKKKLLKASFTLCSEKCFSLAFFSETYALF